MPLLNGHTDQRALVLGQHGGRRPTRHPVRRWPAPPTSLPIRPTDQRALVSVLHRGRGVTRHQVRRWRARPIPLNRQPTYPTFLRGPLTDPPLGTHPISPPDLRPVPQKRLHQIALALDNQYNTSAIALADITYPLPLPSHQLHQLVLRTITYTTRHRHRFIHCNRWGFPDGMGYQVTCKLTVTAH